MTENAPEPTGDDVPDGTQLPADPTVAARSRVIEEGDAGVNDTGDEQWYQEDPPLAEMPD